MVTDREKFNQLRKEYNKKSFKKFLDEFLPKGCYYCHDTENLTFHHIIPLANGGDNRINNFLRLCDKCHKAVHSKTHSVIQESYNKNGTQWGRPKKDKPPNCNKILYKFMIGEISNSEAWEMLRNCK